ncbi:unnamed protein product [Paramecium primaurelia]|uniref:Uncharacterized protein n=1 Tax=Paramecium primaurelia TaxID=5886 RepID=A0A8S1JSP0_PARPR|nr:unnamed protein product [Paramecium primaurelia]
MLKKHKIFYQKLRYSILNNNILDMQTSKSTQFQLNQKIYILILIYLDSQQGDKKKIYK